MQLSFSWAGCAHGSRRRARVAAARAGRGGARGSRLRARRGAPARSAAGSRPWGSRKATGGEKEGKRGQKNAKEGRFAADRAEAAGGRAAEAMAGRVGRALLAVVLLACTAGADAALLNGARRRQRQREERTGRAVFATGCGVTGYWVASRMTTTYQPGKMAYFKVKRPLFTPTQRISAGLALVACGLVLEESLGLARSENALGGTLRGAGRLCLRFRDNVQERWDDIKRRRQAEENREWGRAHTRSARIHTR